MNASKRIADEIAAEYKKHLFKTPLWAFAHETVRVLNNNRTLPPDVELHRINKCVCGLVTWLAVRGIEVPDFDFFPEDMVPAERANYVDALLESIAETKKALVEKGLLSIEPKKEDLNGASQ